jgi:hypothetical protein
MLVRDKFGRGGSIMRWKHSHATVVAYVALAVAMSGTAFAATGGTFTLGHANTAGQTTALNNTGTGAALALSSRSGTPALAVSDRAKVVRLNADLLDGLDSSALQRRVAGTCPSISGIRSVTIRGGVLCADHAYRVVTSSTSVAVPAGVTHALVEVRGAGGGGSVAANGANGGGGGQGGGELALLTVAPGSRLLINVGVGGAGGTSGVLSGSGGSGMATTVIRESNGALLAKADGGGGAVISAGCPDANTYFDDTNGGAGGSPEPSTATGAVGLRTEQGQSGIGSGFSPGCLARGGTGGGRGMTGAGGDGGTAPSGDGAQGKPGFVLIQWL